MLKYLCITVGDNGLTAMVLKSSTVEILLNTTDRRTRITVFEINTDSPVHTLMPNNTWVPVPEPSPDGNL